MTVDNVIINGTTIGHTDDTDLLTLASGALTVAGTVRMGTSTETANTNFDDLVIENVAGHSGITIFSKSDSDGAIYFGDVEANNLGQIKYLHGSNAMTFATNDGSASLTLDSGLNATFAGDVAINGALTSNIACTITGNSGYEDIMYIKADGTNINSRINLIPTGTGDGVVNTTANELILQTGGTNALKITDAQQIELHGVAGADGYTLPYDQNPGYCNFSAGGFGFLFREAHDSYTTGNLYYYKTGGAQSWRYKFGSAGAGIMAIDDGNIAFSNVGSGSADAVASLNEVLRLNTSGNMGLGTSTIRQRFHQHVGDSGANYHAFTNTGTGTASTDGSVVGIDDAENLLLWQQENLDVRIGSAGSDRIRVKNDGKVGIGTTSPSTTLEVAGDVTIASEHLIHESSSPEMYFYTTGNHYNWMIAAQENVDTALEIGVSGSTSTSLSTTASDYSAVITANKDREVGIGITGIYNDFAALQLDGRGISIKNDKNGSSNNWSYIQNDGTGSESTIIFTTGGQATAFKLNHDGSAVFTDNITTSGALSKGSGSFKIDHPLESKKDTHHLIHSFIEGPKADLIYRGKVTLKDGSATVNIDTVSNMTEGTFVALNTDIQCFTTNESNWDLVKGSVSGNILTITSNNSSSTATISWMVIGERHDDNIKSSMLTDNDGKIIVEVEKTETE